MNLQIISFNGVELNDGVNFNAWFPEGSVMLMPEGTPGFVERSYFGPVFTYKKRQPRTLPIHVAMLGDIAAQLDTLKALFNPYSQDEYELLVEDLDDNNKRWYINGTPISMPKRDGQLAVFNLWVADPIWKTKTEISTSWAVTGTGDQETINVGGSFYSEPTFEITPTAAKAGGKAYRIFCPVYNPSTTITYTDYPLDIVNNALNTAALVADTSRHVTINDGDGITDADTTITYDGAVGTFPTSGLAYLGTEQISYTGKSATELTGCTRGVNGTSAAAHLDDVVIYASKMEADGGDIQVTVDGIQDNYWLQDINNATTQIWINVDLLPGYAMTNGVIIADSGAIITITLENSTANIDAINALPSNGGLMIGTELFTYTSKNVTTRQFTGTTRAAHNTSMAAHAVGDAVRWIEHEIYIYHGVHDLPAFVVDDDYKPYIELDSTNASWTWDATFSKTDATSHWILKTGGWRGGLPQYWSSVNETALHYYADVGAPNVNGYYQSMAVSAPSTQTQTNGITFTALGQWCENQDYSTYVFCSWYIFIPSGFTHVAANGNRWQSSVAGTDWFDVATNYAFMMGYSVVALPTFSNAFSVSAPASPDTVDAWTQGSLALGGTYNYFAFRPTRAIANKDGEVRLEVTDLTFTLLSTTIPVASAGSSVEYYHINSSLVNTTTGEYIDVDYYLNLNTALIINTAVHTVVDNDSGAYERGAIQLSTYRHDWLKMVPGANVLEWDETGATGLTIVVKRRERKL